MQTLLYLTQKPIPYTLYSFNALLIGPSDCLQNITSYELQHVIDTDTRHSLTWICLSNQTSRVCASSPSGSLALTFSLSWASESSASGSPWHATITIHVVQVVAGLAVQANGQHYHHLLIDNQ